MRNSLADVKVSKRKEWKRNFDHGVGYQIEGTTMVNRANGLIKGNHSNKEDCVCSCKYYAAGYHRKW
jgi:hypothetical protein